MTAWQLLLMGAEVKGLRKEGLISIGDVILLREEAFDEMFPTGWEEHPFTDSEGKTVTFRTIRIDGQTFESVRYE